MADFSQLPGILADIAAVAGPVSALRLAEARGGTRVWIPEVETLHQDHWLVEAVGMEAAVKICEAMGKGPVDVPCGPVSARSRIWAALKRGLADGLTANQLARLGGVSRRTVFRHKSGESASGCADDQHKLF